MRILTVGYLPFVCEPLGLSPRGMHHLVRGYGAAGHDVIYVDFPFALRRRRSLSRFVRGWGIRTVAPGVRNIVPPPSLPGVENRSVFGIPSRTLSLAGLAAFVRILLRGKRFRPDVVIAMQLPFGPQVFDVAPPTAKRIYYCDDLPGYRETTGVHLQLEASAVKASDMVFCSSARHSARLAPLGRPVHTFPHAVEATRFRAPATAEERSREGRPTVLYFGQVSDRLDGSLIARVAARMKHVRFRFVGPGHSGFRIHGDNIEVAGPVPYADVPKLLQDADVVWLPYAHGDNQKFIGPPLKLYEALLVGRPVVMTAVTDIGEAAAVVDEVDGVENQVAALTRALQPDPARIARGRELAECNTYAARVQAQTERFEQLVGAS